MENKEQGPFDQRLSILKDDEYKKLFAFKKDDFSVKEVFLYFSQQFNISDISIKAEEIDEIVA